jgi:sodium transport system permease protein
VTIAWVVFRKELQETLRDRRTLMMMVAVPVLLYPILMISAEQLTLMGLRQLESEPSVVGVSGPATDPAREFLGGFEEVTLREVSDASGAVRSDSVDAVALFAISPVADSTRTVTIVYDAANERSQRARALLARALGDWGDTLVAQRLSERGLPSGLAQPLSVADSSVALAEELGGYALGRFLPLLLILMTLLGTFYPAIDLAAGEKERGTLEALLTAPVPAQQIVVGKFLTVALIGVIAAALNLGSMLLTFQTGLFRFGDAFDIDFALPLGAVALIFVTLVPLAILFGSLFLGVALRSRSFKEAQNALTPIYLAVILPALLPVFPGIEFTVALAAVPVAGVGLFFRELMTGGPALLPSLVAVVTTLLWAWAALAFATVSFGREQVLFGEGDGRVESGSREIRAQVRAWLGPRGSTPQPIHALVFMLVVGAFFFYLGFPLQARLGETGLLLSEWMLLFTPAVLFVTLGGFNARATLSLRAPRSRQLGAAFLLIAGAMPLGWFLAWIQGFVIPVPWELLEGLDELLTAGSTPRLLWLLVIFAVTPALCEEFVFRGVLLGGTRANGSIMRAALLNGLVFGVFHVSFESVFRFLPTAWLGVVLAWAVLTTSSIWVGALMHFVNNGVIVLIASSPGLRAWFESGGEAPPWLLLPPAIVSMIVGVRLLRVSVRSDDSERSEGGASE